VALSLVAKAPPACAMASGQGSGILSSDPLKKMTAEAQRAQIVTRLREARIRAMATAVTSESSMATVESMEGRGGASSGSVTRACRSCQGSRRILERCAERAIVAETDIAVTECFLSWARAVREARYVLSPDGAKWWMNLLEATADDQRMLSRCLHEWAHAVHGARTEALKPALDRMKEEHGRLQEEHLRLEEEHDSLKVEHRSLQEKHDSLKEEHCGLKEEYDSLKEGHDSLNKGHDNLKEEHDSLKEEHCGLKEKHDRLSEEHDSLNGEHSSLQEQHDGLQGRHTALNEEHDGLKEKHGRLKLLNVRVLDSCGNRGIAEQHAWLLSTIVLTWVQALANKKKRLRNLLRYAMPDVTMLEGCHCRWARFVAERRVRSVIVQYGAAALELPPVSKLLEAWHGLASGSAYRGWQHVLGHISGKAESQNKLLSAYLSEWRNDTHAASAGGHAVNLQKRRGRWFDRATARSEYRQMPPPVRTQTERIMSRSVRAMVGFELLVIVQAWRHRARIARRLSVVNMAYVAAVTFRDSVIFMERCFQAWYRRWARTVSGATRTIGKRLVDKAIVSFAHYCVVSWFGKVVTIKNFLRTKCYPDRDVLLWVCTMGWRSGTSAEEYSRQTCARFVLRTLARAESDKLSTFLERREKAVSARGREVVRWADRRGR